MTASFDPICPFLAIVIILAIPVGIGVLYKQRKSRNEFCKKFAESLGFTARIGNCLGISEALGEYKGFNCRICWGPLMLVNSGYYPTSIIIDFPFRGEPFYFHLYHKNFYCRLDGRIIPADDSEFDRFFTIQSRIYPDINKILSPAVRELLFVNKDLLLNNQIILSVTATDITGGIIRCNAGVSIQDTLTLKAVNNLMWEIAKNLSEKEEKFLETSL